MNKSILARVSTGISGAAAVAAATLAMAPTASAQLSITQTTAYCVGTTYTITFPAADAAAMAARYGQNDFVLGATNTTNVYTEWSAPVTYVSGQDVTFQWTAKDAPSSPGTAVGTWNLFVEEAHTTSTATPPLVVNVVKSAPAGTTCTPSTGGTGSASSIPVIGGLLSSLSAQK
ncbi:hypothetical protein [Nocardia sp. NPDC051981]|uniref:hypothetical protein n=1 Tax=Nocardia sp. NPDC051981 TaxID=3155417 RepID=UPI00341F6AAC